MVIKSALQSISPHRTECLEQRSLCFEHLRYPDRRETRYPFGTVPERKYSCQTDSESYSPELPASVGNVSEITVVGLMGVNTVADGVQYKGGWGGGVSWLLLSTLSCFLWCADSVSELTVHINR